MKSSNKFYADATFYSTSEVLDLLRHAGFNQFRICQTIFSHPDSKPEAYEPLAQRSAPDAVIDGYGKGAFVVIASIKQ